MSATQTQRNISQGITRKSSSLTVSKRLPTTATRAQVSKRYTHKSTQNNRGFATIALMQEKQLLISRGILGFFVASLCLYLYMVVSIVIATVDRKAIEEKVRNQSTELSAIESEYSTAIGSVTLADVKNLGYIDAGEATFAVRDINPTLTLRND